MSRELHDLIRGFELSTYRENTFEQVFCAELLQAGWIAGYPPFEIDRPFVDFAGYDLVVSCGPVTRHVQMKATRGRVTVHRALAQKPSGCVLNLRPTAVGTPERLRFVYDVAAAAPGEPLDLGGLAAAKKVYNTRLEDGSFGKVEREHHVVLPAGRFVKGLSIDDLLVALFGGVTD